jgi:hypothetical protein
MKMWSAPLHRPKKFLHGRGARVLAGWQEVQREVQYVTKTAGKTRQSNAHGK